MNTDKFLTDAWQRLSEIDWATTVFYAAPLLLLLFALYAWHAKRPDRHVTMLATVIGLAWSAQGMWDTAVHHYGVVKQLAVILFVLFEAMMVGRMLTANRYRRDLVRRARPVRFVWTLAVVAGLVVAFAEGWQQAPLRFAVPLLVAWNWYLDLTADDNPADRQPTSWRWTPRRLLLAIGALEPGERDAVTINRERHINRMTSLAFKVKNGSAPVGDLLRRPTRLARLALDADEDMIREMHERLARADVVLDPPKAPRPKPTARLIVPDRKIVLPDRENLVQGVHVRDGRPLRGADLKSDALMLMRMSMTADRPRGMTIADLAAHYEPPLRRRTAESFAAEARRHVNGAAVG